MPVPRMPTRIPESRKPDLGISGEGSRSATTPRTDPCDPNTDYVVVGTEVAAPGVDCEQICQDMSVHVPLVVEGTQPAQV